MQKTPLVPESSPGHESAANAEGINDNEDSPAPSDCGSMRVTSSESRYVGGAHWAAILDGIADLKEHFDKGDVLLRNDDSDVPKMHHVKLLYSCKPVSKAEILYEKFWIAPFETPIMSLAVLASETPESHSTLDIYREKVVQCLNLGEYTKPGPYTSKTLFHYVTIEYSIRKDAEIDIWILFSISVNLAMRMSYHRDPSHFTDISPFAGEMRRRAWATILQGDILISTQMGMPRVIKDWQCDIREPRNPNDSDFDEHAKELPLSRPKSEMTTSLHLVARRRVFIALVTVVDLTTDVQPCTYADVMRVDQLLKDAEATVPSYVSIPELSLNHLIT